MIKSIFFVCLAISILTLLSCSSVEETEDSASTKTPESERLAPKLSKISAEPEDFELAAMQRQQLLREIDDILASMTGDEFELTNDRFLSKLRADFRAIQQGISRLEVEKSEHGLTFRQEMNDFLEALKDHLNYLRVIHKKLEYIPDLPESEETQTQPSDE